MVIYTSVCNVSGSGSILCKAEMLTFFLSVRELGGKFCLEKKAYFAESDVIP